MEIHRTRRPRIWRSFADIPVVVLIGLMVLTLSACGQHSSPTPAPATIVVESGVMALTPVANLDPASDETTETLPEPLVGLPEVATMPDAFVIGAEVQARGMLRLYGAPEPTALTLAEYSAGERFTVMEPPSDVSVYPVEINGVRWYRVRADDGLVGWAIADGLEPAPSEVS